jgi:glutamate 5-kinase
MESKVAAAELAAAGGIATVIAGGATEDPVLPAIVAGEARGTRFAAAEGPESAFKLWLRFGKRVVAHLHVDAGARHAVREDGRSLLAVGVVSWDGDFRAGDGVALLGPDGEPFARGIASVDAAELDGQPANVEAVHRDRLVVLR